MQSTRSGSIGILTYQSPNVSIVTPWKVPLALEAMGWNAFNHPWTHQVVYVFPPPPLIPLILSTFLVEHVTSQLRLLILMALCWMEVPWLPTVLKILEEHFSVLSCYKRSHHGHFSRASAQGSALDLTLWLLRDVLYRQGFSYSVCQAVVEVLKHLQQKSTSNVGKNGWGWCASEGVPNNAISSPYLADFLVHLF